MHKLTLIGATVVGAVVVVRSPFMSPSYKHCPVTPCASGTIQHEQFRVGFPPPVTPRLRATGKR